MSTSKNALVASLWSENPMERLSSARRLDPTSARIVREQLSTGAPVRPWPYGMPTVVNPLVVVLGVSPGNSPSMVDARRPGARTASGLPTLGSPHPGMAYRDTRYYWDKVRALLVTMVREYAPDLPVADCLALSGHLNLGLASAGSATLAATDEQVTTWVSGLIATQLRPRVVIGVGLNGIITNSAFRRAWERGGLGIDWDHPQYEQQMAGYSYRFRAWHSRRVLDGLSTTFLLWPNHPSRHPFAGAPGSSWFAAIRQAGEILRGFRVYDAH